MRRTSEQVLAEFHRMYDFLGALTDCWDEVLSTTHATRMHSREIMLGALSKGATASDILRGTQEALNDRSEELMDLLQDRPAIAHAILRGYREKQGRDLWDDIGHPMKLLKRILKRQRITDETEYRLLSAYLGNQTQQLLKLDEMEKAGVMLSQFEASMK